MPSITKKQRSKIHEKTVLTIRRLLTFHVSVSSLQYIHDDAVTRWREFEERLHNGYPIKGVGVIATRSALKAINESDGGFLHTDEDLSPSDVPEELQSFPYHAASAAYAFTLLEGYGDEIAEIVNPGKLKARQAWHHGVYGDTDLKDPAALAKARDAFAKVFSRPSSKVGLYVVRRLVSIKEIRNTIMHEGHVEVNFQDFFGNVVGTVLAIYFLATPEKKFSLYPYYDYSEKWA